MKHLDCINTITSAYIAMEQATKDRDDVIESALDELAGSVALTADDRKNMKRIAKAIASGNKEKILAESESLAKICGYV